MKDYYFKASCTCCIRKTSFNNDEEVAAEVARVGIKKETWLNDSNGHAHQVDTAAGYFDTRDACTKRSSSSDFIRKTGIEVKNDEVKVSEVWQPRMPEKIDDPPYEEEDEDDNDDGDD